MKQALVNGKEVSKITLGTVQLGMNYGIANNGGQPNREKSFEMLRCAIEHGITSFDTARTYGNSEDVIGEFLQSNKIENQPFITSKLKIGLSPESSEKEVEAAMYASLETSLSKLGIEKLDCLMLHTASDMTTYGEIVPKTLEAMVKKGYAAMAGVSTYHPEELDTVLQNDIYEAVQVPMSIFDQKLIHNGYIKKLKEKSVAVFVRSVFLQGVFFLEPETISDPLLLEYAKPYIEVLHDYCRTEGMSVAEFAISFIRDVDGVSSLVLGAETKEQVMENIKYINAPSISKKTRDELTERFKNVNIQKIMEVLSRPKK